VEKYNACGVAATVRVFGLGHAIDKVIEPQEIADPVLSALWTETQVKMNEIQIYLEEHGAL
jgi:hypothetical protein